MNRIHSLRSSVSGFFQRRAKAFSKKELGQNMLEYVGLVILAAGVVAAIMGLGMTDKVKTAFTDAVGKVIPGIGGGGPDCQKNPDAKGC